MAIKPDNGAMHHWQVSLLVVYREHFCSLKSERVDNARTVSK